MMLFLTLYALLQVVSRAQDEVLLRFSRASVDYSTPSVSTRDRWPSPPSLRCNMVSFCVERAPCSAVSVRALSFCADVAMCAPSRLPAARSCFFTRALNKRLAHSAPHPLHNAAEKSRVHAPSLAKNMMERVDVHHHLQGTHQLQDCRRRPLKLAHDRRRRRRCI